jgi:hypothetical protein
MLNSFVILAQGSRADDGRLAWLESDILPTFIKQTSRRPIDEDNHHPLCMAALLQVIYTPLARCGSFNFLGCSNSRNKNTRKEINFVYLMLRCVLALFH